VAGGVSGNRVILVATVVDPNYINQPTLTGDLKNGLKEEYAGCDNSGKLWTGRFAALRKKID
jgi:hypothetical protein